MRQLPARDPGVPDSRSVNRFLLWVWREQWRSQALGVFWGMAWMVSIAMMPAMIGRAIDHGLLARSTSGLLTWTGVVLGLSVFAAVAGAMRHRSAMTNWLAAAYITVQVTARHAVKVGADLPKLIASGDVLAIGTTDIEAVGGTFDILARLTGAVVSTIVVAIIMLTTSVPLGLVVLIGVPVTLGCTVFLMRPLHRRQDTYRELQGKLSDQTVDIAQGIRILRGIGGEDAFSARYAAGSQRLRGIGIRVGRVESLLSAEEVLLPGLLTGLVTWLAAHFALHGEITVGQLVAFYGYASFLVMPLATFGEAANSVTRGHVAAGHVIRLLRINSPITQPESPVAPPPSGVLLSDADSGLTITPGELLAIACADPEEAERLANRLARYVDDGAPTLGDVPLKDLSVRVVRERILAAGNADRVFTGTLRSSLAGMTNPPEGGGIDAVVMEALHAASAEDIVAALDGGLDAEVEEKGRNFSGGQLQRLRLARALIADPEFLIAVEATSAVDAHTEARIAARIGAYRASRSGPRATALFTTSPLVLSQADVVAYVEDGRVVATGRHGELLAGQPHYRALVTRGEDDAETAESASSQQGVVRV
ncbi:ABC transporter ATP-binding protein [Actinospica sp. MGRD01-02]|uniref:ABC transporter ATP-binding protein n=1 Tax=Actinospica acidithermotolerans TaxID=2828514 RepID=A0A941EGY8_9ACTN|nr:ABC transporter ATP-binding protein [Actinospica acidithermotolerans]MBR7830470.1 ABC transporter ATP-binding protein [Actinospica acidithermotolerans]